MAVEGTGFTCRNASTALATAMQVAYFGNLLYRLCSAGPVSPGRDDAIGDYTAVVSDGIGDNPGEGPAAAIDFNRDDVIQTSSGIFTTNDPIVASDVVQYVLVILDSGPGILLAVLTMQPPVEFQYGNQFFGGVFKRNVSDGGSWHASINY